MKRFGELDIKFERIDDKLDRFKIHDFEIL